MGGFIGFRNNKVRNVCTISGRRSLNSGLDRLGISGNRWFVTRFTVADLLAPEKGTDVVHCTNDQLVD